MSSKFRIDVNWLGGDDVDPIQRAMFGELLISVNGHVATKVEDTFANALRDRIRVSAYDLAVWLAASWWRLRWEPPRAGTFWKMSHALGAVGGGYVWPDLSLSSDGETVTVRSRETKESDTQPVRYLQNFDTQISAKSFETAIDRFLETVTSRLRTENAGGEDLVDLWGEVCAERQDPPLAAWRKLEAMLGCDPDEAPEGLIEMLQGKADVFGTSAVEEVAAMSEQASPTFLNELNRLEKLRDLASTQAIQIRVEGANDIRFRIRAKDDRSGWSPPWRRAEFAARSAREVLGVEAGKPLDSVNLAKLLGAREHEWAMGGEQSFCKTHKISAGFRNGEEDSIAVYFHSAHKTSRRFALARLVGDLLEAADATESLLPATTAKTARQKFQRAFAQELLCPLAGLQELLGIDEFDDADGIGEFDDEDIESAADHFQVSPLMVRTTLVKKRMMNRDLLDA